MLAKIRVEAGEYHFIRGLGIQIVTSFVFGRFYLERFPLFHSGGSLGRYLVFVLDRYYYILIFYPLLSLLLTCNRYQGGSRYPVLLRYRSRNEFFCVRLLCKIGFVVLSMLAFLGILYFTGRGELTDMEQCGGIIASQCMNIFCYLCTLLLIYEILEGIIGNLVLNYILTALLPMLNLIVEKLHHVWIAKWMPWGNIGYANGVVKPVEYHFYWWYWLFVLVFLAYIADVLNGRKDYVFGRSNKAN